MEKTYINAIVSSRDCILSLVTIFFVTLQSLFMYY